MLPALSCIEANGSQGQQPTRTTPAPCRPSAGPECTSDTGPKIISMGAVLFFFSLAFFFFLTAPLQTSWHRTSSLLLEKELHLTVCSQAWGKCVCVHSSQSTMMMSVCWSTSFSDTWSGKESQRCLKKKREILFLIFCFREADCSMLDFALPSWLGSHGWRCEWTLRCLVRDLMSAESVDDTSAGVC